MEPPKTARDFVRVASAEMPLPAPPTPPPPPLLTAREFIQRASGASA
jgi:hypothetical protein